MTFTWPDLTTKVIARQDLTRAETAWAMDSVMSGEASPIQLAGFLTALATKGETAEEFLGLADSMQAHARPVELTSESLDIVGTGGDRLRTVNISTTAALVIAAGGVKVVKHGNRASSSKSGSADCLEELGVDLDLPIPAVEKIFHELGITFLFANLFHPAMKYAARARKELAVATAFNVLGTLTNPAQPVAGAIGVANASRAPLVAGVLERRKNRALVFRGENGLDELSSAVRNQVWEVRDGTTNYYEFDAAELGLPQADISDLLGADAAYNAKVTREVLAGARGPVRDSVCLNAAGAFVADGQLAGVRPQDGTFLERMANGLEIATQTIDSGAASALLANWVALSDQLSE
ncbi:MAG: anthranilate phosphoribosyltransferase [Trueperella sp.]|nr:anthranilate phosphoribosyltransferase [Trueperella sp.]